ncbi:MAG: hypothetical protein ACREKG_01935 [Candidatus Rokuibacteriota bacterium]
MRQRSTWRRPEIVGVLLLALTGSGWAQVVQAFNITGLRTDPVTLYEDCKMDPKTQITVTREQFKGQGPWAATKDASPLFFRVDLNKKVYCVKAFSVQTDQTVRVEKEECDAKVAGRPPKTGAVRGVGEGCRP